MPQGPDVPQNVQHIVLRHQFRSMSPRLKPREGYQDESSLQATPNVQVTAKTAPKRRVLLDQTRQAASHCCHEVSLCYSLHQTW